jgi:WD40 repeat protein
VKLWDVATCTATAAFRGHTGQVVALALTPDGKTAASVSDDGLLCLWETADCRARAARRVPQAQTWRLAFSPDGRTLAAASGADETIAVWDVAQGRQRDTFRGHDGPVVALGFLADGRAASADAGGSALLWDADTLRVTRTWRLPPPATPPGEWPELDEPRAWSPDGRTLVTAGADLFRPSPLKLWDAGRGTVRATLPGHTARVAALAFTPDGRLLASAAWDGTARLWDVAAGKELASFEAGTPQLPITVALSRDGRLLTAAGPDGLRLWAAREE